MTEPQNLIEAPEEENPLELLLVRHGESWYNRDGTGGLDSELTERGVEQARRLGPWLAAHYKFTAIYSSALLRARQTAEIAAAELGLPIQYRESLREVDFLMSSLLPHYAEPAEALASPTHLIDEMAPAYQGFAARITGAMVEIVRENPRGTILIFTHGGVIATFLRIVFGAHQVSVYADNTSALLLRWRNQRWYLVYSNCIEHLRT